MGTNPLKSYMFTVDKEITEHDSFPLMVPVHAIVYYTHRKEYYIGSIGQRVNKVNERMVPDWIKSYVLILS